MHGNGSESESGKRRTNEAAWRTWIAALRSGQFAQTTSWLGYREALPSGEMACEYCCLGVACTLAPGVELVWEQSGNLSGRLRADTSTLRLPAVAAGWLGLAPGELDVEIEVTDAVRDLLPGDDKYRWERMYGYPRGMAVYLKTSQLNDVLAMDFSGIADVLELELARRLVEEKEEDGHDA